jgi:hypothetical protein
MSQAIGMSSAVLTMVRLASRARMASETNRIPPATWPLATAAKRTLEEPKARYSTVPGSPPYFRIRSRATIRVSEPTFPTAKPLPPSSVTAWTPGARAR